ncbi:hypothetical protein [Micromonospora echinofusca]|uniref:Uncharacterized protein n=1 Tax=Micromonospora echinofusca TaxID=47858 RepID=A0A1C5G8U7_MICEH|nr:hypothetical protein [Micromonospora echinofusca]SCG16161.1 hypothetical protein GA0070610_2418 [Micromonospora echinofusca]
MSTSVTELSELRRRLTRVILVHVALSVGFALLAAGGVSSSAGRAGAFAVPWLVIGVAGALGALLIAAAAWQLRAGRSSGSRWAVRWEASARLGMALAAAVALAVGVAVAPAGSERGFVIGVDAALAGALALFALAAGDVRRAVRSSERTAASSAG